MTDHLDDLHAAIKAAIPDLTNDPFEQDLAAWWLTTATGLPHDEATRVIRKLATAVGTRNGVRVLDALIDLGWRPGGERQHHRR